MVEGKWFTGKEDEAAVEVAFINSKDTRHTGHCNGASTIIIQKFKIQIEIQFKFNSNSLESNHEKKRKEYAGEGK